MAAPVCECGEQTYWEACSEAKYHFLYGSREARELEAMELVLGPEAQVWLCYGCGEWGAFAFPASARRR